MAVMCGKIPEFPVIHGNGLYPDVLSRVKRHVDNLSFTANLPDGVHDILLEDWHFWWRGRYYTVPKGFVTDYASIPRIFWRILPMRGPYNRAALAHDFLYWSGLLTRDESDLVLFELALYLGVGKWDARLLYLGVKVGGRSAWESYRISNK